jgi:heat shock protein HtpX
VLQTPLDFVARQQLNRNLSRLLLGTFLAVFVALGFAVDVTWTGFLSGGAPLPLATFASLTFAGTLSLAGYFRGADMVIGSLYARPLDPEVPEQHQLANVVAEMALASGLPPPRVYVIPDPSPNALAAGRDPQHAVVAVTQGLLNLLDRAETQGVVAHELAHIHNRDTLTMTLVSILFGGVMMLADWARRTLYFDRGRKTHPLLAVAVLLLVAFTPLLSRFLAMAVSRQREYLADASAVQFTRNPLGLASALEKIGAATSPLRAATRGTAHLFISNPWPRRLDRQRGAVADLLSTHPPLAQRIAILRAMARG